MLNEFFTELTAAAYEHEGTVFSMAGDSMLVGFNVPVPQSKPTERALAAARTMIEHFRPVAQRWKTWHNLSVGIGIGIEAGEVVVGNVGSPVFMSYTIIGDSVNVAARLMQMAAANEILIGPSAYLSLQGVLGRTAVTRREVMLRGKSEALEVMSLRVAA
jgi:class 3 adenylate cyclase